MYYPLKCKSTLIMTLVRIVICRLNSKCLLQRQLHEDFPVHFAKVSVHKIFRFHAQREQATCYFENSAREYPSTCRAQKVCINPPPCFAFWMLLGFALGNVHVNLRISSVRIDSSVFACDVNFASDCFCLRIYFRHSMSLPADGTCPRMI